MNLNKQNGEMASFNWSPSEHELYGGVETARGSDSFWLCAFYPLRQLRGSQCLSLSGSGSYRHMWKLGPIAVGSGFSVVIGESAIGKPFTFRRHFFLWKSALHLFV
jgi:hypothetical protein